MRRQQVAQDEFLKALVQRPPVQTALLLHRGLRDLMMSRAIWKEGRKEVENTHTHTHIIQKSQVAPTASS